MRRAILAILATLAGLPAAAATLPPGMIGVGAAGIAGPNGVVTAPPKHGPHYYYVSTAGGAKGAGFLPGKAGNSRTGSRLTTRDFEADAGSELRFYFDYVTSDGGSYPDYAWAILADAATAATKAVLFTARTKPSGPIVPGQWLPPADATFDPAVVKITPGAPHWSKLGDSSGACFSQGCGHTGWIRSTYTVPHSGTYKLLFGVTNWTDDAYDSGLAIAGATIDDVAIAPVPGPASGLLLVGALAAFGWVRGPTRAGSPGTRPRGA